MLQKQIKQYLNIYHDMDDDLILNLSLAAIEYIKSYTGRDKAWMDSNKDITDFLITQVTCVMYESRGLDSQQFKPNMMLKSMLDLHSTNLL